MCIFFIALALPDLLVKTLILAFLAHSSHTRSPDSGGAREAAALPTGRESAVVCTPARLRRGFGCRVERRRGKRR
jgi:hypothetical protein